MDGLAVGGLTEVTVFQSGTEGYHTFRIPARRMNGLRLLCLVWRFSTLPTTSKVLG
jgi:hypothetical protein